MLASPTVLAGRMHAVFCARGAPEFWIFCIFFARVWLKVCMTSTPDAYFSAFGRTSDLFKSFNDLYWFTQRMLADFK